MTILRSDQLKTAQNIAIALKGLALVLSLLTFLAFGAAIYLSRDERWVTVLFCGIGLVAAGFAVIVAREVAGGIVVDQLVTNESVKPAAEETWSIATSLMTSIATTAIVDRRPLRHRRLARLADRLGAVDAAGAGAGAAASTPPTCTPGWRSSSRIYFLSAPTQNLRSFLTTLAIAGLAAFGIHELRQQAHEEYPDAELRRDLRPDQGPDGRRGQRAPTSASAPRNCACPRCGRPERRRGGRRQASEDARLERLERLGDLHEKGVLNNEEFAAEKARVLGTTERRRLRTAMETIEVRRRYAIWAIVGVCVLSAAIGAAHRPDRRDGTGGPRGERGPAGPRGRRERSTPARSKPKSKLSVVKSTSPASKNRSRKTKNGSKNSKTSCAAPEGGPLANSAAEVEFFLLNYMSDLNLVNIR